MIWDIIIIFDNGHIDIIQDNPTITIIIQNTCIYIPQYDQPQQIYYVLVRVLTYGFVG